MNEMTLKIIEAAEKRGLTSFGIRQHHAMVNIGDDLGVSYNSIDDCTPVELDGICCLAIGYDGFDVDDIEYDLDQLAEMNYQDGSVILVGGTSHEDGNDADEIVIGNPEILWVF